MSAKFKRSIVHNVKAGTMFVFTVQSDITPSGLGMEPVFLIDELL